MEIEKEQLGVPKSVRRRGETLIFEDLLKMSADIEKRRAQAIVKVRESENARKLHTYATFVLSKTERFPAYPASSIENAKNSMGIITFSIFLSMDGADAAKVGGRGGPHGGGVFKRH